MPGQLFTLESLASFVLLEQMVNGSSCAVAKPITLCHHQQEQRLADPISKHESSKGIGLLQLQPWLQSPCLQWGSSALLRALKLVQLQYTGHNPPRCPVNSSLKWTAVVQEHHWLGSATKVRKINWCFSVRPELDGLFPEEQPNIGHSFLAPDWVLKKTYPLPCPHLRDVTLSCHACPLLLSIGGEGTIQETDTVLLVAFPWSASHPSNLKGLDFWFGFMKEMFVGPY